LKQLQAAADLFKSQQQFPAHYSLPTTARTPIRQAPNHLVDTQQLQRAAKIALQHTTMVDEDVLEESLEVNKGSKSDWSGSNWKKRSTPSSSNASRGIPVFVSLWLRLSLPLSMLLFFFKSVSVTALSPSPHFTPSRSRTKGSCHKRDSF